MRSLILVILIAAGAARADDPLAEAREHYRKGTALYDLRRYADAAKEYEQAFVLKDDPVLLFNIGQAYRFAGDHEAAIAAYKAFLRRVAKATNRSEVESRILEMQELLDERRRSDAKPPQGMIAPEPRAIEKPPAPKPVELAPKPVERPVHKSTRPRIIWGIVAGAAVVVAAGITVGVVLGTQDTTRTLPAMRPE